MKDIPTTLGHRRGLYRLLDAVRAGVAHLYRLGLEAYEAEREYRRWARASRKGDNDDHTR